MSHPYSFTSRFPSFNHRNIRLAIVRATRSTSQGVSLIKRYFRFAILMAAAAINLAAQQPPPSYSPPQLDQLVARVALYPDPLLAQILAAATYPNDIPAAATWADQHHYLTGQPLADAIQADQLPWDPSVQALLPFPSVLDMMASDPTWTMALGNAFLADQNGVMDAVQRARKLASSYGYLRSNGQIAVTTGPAITILPVNPGYIPIPYYDPGVVFVAPSPGFYVGGAIHFGYGIQIGAFFQPWGWGLARFNWGGHAVIINNSIWQRTWVNRASYAHPYPFVRPVTPRPPEVHRLEPRTERERSAAAQGRPRVEDHHRR
jgi:hypothetical protein